MRSNLYNQSATNIISDALDDANEDEEIIIANPSKKLIKATVDAAYSFDETIPKIKLLASPDQLKDTFDDFLIASPCADLINNGILKLKTITQDVNSTLIISENTTASLVTIGDSTTALTSEEDEFVGNAREEYNSQWEAKAKYTLRTPPITKINETLAEDIGKDTLEDFQAILNTVNSVTGDDSSLSIVTICLIAAARNNVLLYDISKWGEDIGIASKATFSRTKTELENCGIIETEKVPIDIGRPRLKLKLTGKLEEADINEIEKIALSILD